MGILAGTGRASGLRLFTGHDFGFSLREPSLASATTATQLGGSDNDRLDGTSGNDLLVGSSGRDLLQGGSGDDLLFADAQVELPEGPGFGGTTPYADAVIKEPRRHGARTDGAACL